jgi:hypothetical protein
LLGCLALPAEANTIADWRFEEGSGVVFLNSIVRGPGRNNNGVLINQLGYMRFIFQNSRRFSLFFDGINDNWLPRRSGGLTGPAIWVE